MALSVCLCACVCRACLFTLDVWFACPGGHSGDWKVAVGALQAEQVSASTFK